ncbi:purple acid phosphatase [Acrasis kona]|uniref:Purple acid phosphatase n=1 Tax=Acrasis kona TaxID=1008807 RepID=A0AAW2ZE03_9EUKA
MQVYYRISDDGNQTTEEFSFPTALGNSYNGRKKNVPFKFLTYGDMNVNQDSEDTLRLIKKIIKSDPDVRFIIHQGDIPYAWNGDENIWDRWGDLAQPVTANMPYMVVVGNHESDAGFKAYKHRFTNSTGRNSNSKEGNIYYSFNYQNVHFIGLSTEHNFSRGSRQYNWLKSDLKNIDEDETPFTIIYTHRPMYCSNSNHHEDDIGPKFRDAIEPLFKDYKIDLVLYGHVHAYERTCSISFKSKCEKSVLGKYYYKEPKGTIHLVIGTAGYESNQEWEVKPSWSKYRETSHGLVMITVADNTLLYGKYIRNDETVGDVFMIDKESTPLKKSGLLKEKKSDPVQNPLK